MNGENIKVNGCNPFQTRQQMQKGETVHAAGHTHENPVPVGNHFPFINGFAAKMMQPFDHRPAQNDLPAFGPDALQQ